MILSKKNHLQDCSIFFSVSWGLVYRAADQRTGFASFIWIFQWWKWKFWPLENLIKFSYLSRCSLSWTTSTFCCYVAKTFCPSKQVLERQSVLNWSIYKWDFKIFKTCKYLKMKICLISYWSFPLWAIHKVQKFKISRKTFFYETTFSPTNNRRIQKKVQICCTLHLIIDSSYWNDTQNSDARGLQKYIIKLRIKMDKMESNDY